MFFSYCLKLVTSKYLRNSPRILPRTLPKISPSRSKNLPKSKKKSNTALGRGGFVINFRASSQRSTDPSTLRPWVVVPPSTRDLKSFTAKIAQSRNARAAPCGAEHGRSPSRETSRQKSGSRAKQGGWGALLSQSPLTSTTLPIAGSRRRAGAHACVGSRISHDRVYRYIATNNSEKPPHGGFAQRDQHVVP